MKTIKSLGLILLAALTLSSCQSKQKKAEKVAAKIVKENLYIPESYDPVSTQIDSAFNTPYFDARIREIVNEISTTEYEVSKKKIDLDAAERSINLRKRLSSNGRGLNIYDSQDIEAAQYRYSTLNNEMIDLRTKIISLKREFGTIVNSYDYHEFIGWGIHHKYRAKTQSGIVDFGECVIIVGKDFKTTIRLVDMNDAMENRFSEKYAKLLEEIMK